MPSTYLVCMYVWCRSTILCSVYHNSSKHKLHFPRQIVYLSIILHLINSMMVSAASVRQYQLFICTVQFSLLSPQQLKPTEASITKYIVFYLSIFVYITTYNAVCCPARILSFVADIHRRKRQEDMQPVNKQENKNSFTMSIIFVVESFLDTLGAYRIDKIYLLLHTNK